MNENHRQQALHESMMKAAILEKEVIEESFEEIEGEDQKDKPESGLPDAEDVEMASKEDEGEDLLPDFRDTD